MAGPKVLEIILQAKDQASQAFRTAGNAVGAFREQLSKQGALGDAARSIKTLAVVTKITKTIETVEKVGSSLGPLFGGLGAAMSGEWEQAHEKLQKFREEASALPLSIGPAFRIGNVIGQWLFGDQRDYDQTMLRIDAITGGIEGARKLLALRPGGRPSLPGELPGQRKLEEPFQVELAEATKKLNAAEYALQDWDRLREKGYKPWILKQLHGSREELAGRVEAAKAGVLGIKRANEQNMAALEETAGPDAWQAKYASEMEVARATFMNDEAKKARAIEEDRTAGVDKYVSEMNAFRAEFVEEEAKKAKAVLGERVDWALDEFFTGGVEGKGYGNRKQDRDLGWITSSAQTRGGAAGGDPARETAKDTKRAADNLGELLKFFRQQNTVSLLNLPAN